MISDKPLCRQTGLVQVPLCQRRPADVQFSREPCRGRGAVAVKNIHDAVAQRTTDRDSCHDRQLLIGEFPAVIDQRGDRCFCRAVCVQETDMAKRTPPPSPERLRHHRLAAYDHEPKRVIHRGMIGIRRIHGNRVPVPCRKIHDGQPLCNDLFPQFLCTPEFLTTEDKARAAGQRRKDLLDGGIEAQRRELKDPVTGTDPVHLPARRAMARNRLMSNDHPLRLSGRAGGEHYVGRM